MTDGCKIWLWIIFIANIALLILAFLGGYSALGIQLYTLSVTAQIVGIFAISLMLFRRRMAGFYLYVITLAAAFFVSVLSGRSIIYSIISLIASPAVTYYFIHKNRDIFI